MDQNLADRHMDRSSYDGDPPGLIFENTETKEKLCVSSKHPEVLRLFLWGEITRILRGGE